MEEFGILVNKVRARAVLSRRVHNINLIIMIILVVLLVYLFVYGLLLKEASEPLLVASTVEVGVIKILSELITRVGAVAIGIYAVQILFTFARYHIRMAHYLDSMADALELSEGNSENLSKYLGSFTGHTIDFGKHPTHAADEIIKLLQDITKKLPRG